MELALARVLPSVVGDQQAKGCHSCSIPELNSSETIKQNNQETISQGCLFLFEVKTGIIDTPAILPRIRGTHMPMVKVRRAASQPLLSFS